MPVIGICHRNHGDTKSALHSLNHHLATLPQTKYFISDIFCINIISCFCYVYKELEMLATSTVHKNVVQFLLQNSTVAFFSPPLILPSSHCCERKLNFYCHLMKFFIMHETHSFHIFFFILFLQSYKSRGRKTSAFVIIMMEIYYDYF